MGKFGQESYTPLQVGISATDAQVGAAKEGEQRVRSANPTAVRDQQHYSHDEDAEEAAAHCCCFAALATIFCCMQGGGD